MTPEKRFLCQSFFDFYLLTYSSRSVINTKFWIFSISVSTYFEGKNFALKGTVARDFLASFFSLIYSIWASDFESKRIFFSFSFSRSYSNISMNPRCRLLRGFKNTFLRILKLMVKFDRYKVQLFTT